MQIKLINQMLQSLKKNKILQKKHKKVYQKLKTFLKNIKKNNKSQEKKKIFKQQFKLIINSAVIKKNKKNI